MTTSRKTHPSLYFILILFLYSIKGKKGHIWKMVIFSGFLVHFLLALCSVSSLFFLPLSQFYMLSDFEFDTYNIFMAKDHKYMLVYTKRQYLVPHYQVYKCRFELPLMDSAASHWAIEYHRCAEYTNCSN